MGRSNADWMDEALRRHESAEGPKLPWNRRFTLRLLHEEATAWIQPASTQAEPSEEPKDNLP